LKIIESTEQVLGGVIFCIRDHYQQRGNGKKTTLNLFPHITSLLHSIQR